MKRFLIFGLIALMGAPAFAQNADATPESGVMLDIRDSENVTLSDFLWLNRLIIVFADSDRDPAFQRQMELLLERPEALLERDVIVVIDTNPSEQSEIRTILRPRGFSFVLLDKDGVVKLRKPTPWDVREISRSIDKTDLRQQELREAREAG